MTTMANDKMMAQISVKDGFIAALDQSGGSTPSALRLYGIPDSAYSSDAEMFKLMHEMRVRIMTSPAFPRRQGHWGNSVRSHNGQGETRSRSPRNRSGHTADRRSDQDTPGESC